MARRAAHLGYQPASMYTLQNAIMPYLKDAEGRINVEELERTNLLMPAAGDFDSKIAEKRVGMQQFLAEKGATHPILSGNFIPLPRAPNTKGNSSTVTGYRK
jgi:hypothetical protein